MPTSGDPTNFSMQLIISRFASVSILRSLLICNYSSTIDTIQWRKLGALLAFNEFKVKTERFTT